MKSLRASESDFKKSILPIEPAKVLKINRFRPKWTFFDFYFSDLLVFARKCSKKAQNQQNAPVAPFFRRRPAAASGCASFSSSRCSFTLLLAWCPPMRFCTESPSCAPPPGRAPKNVCISRKTAVFRVEKGGISGLGLPEWEPSRFLRKSQWGGAPLRLGRSPRG